MHQDVYIYYFTKYFQILNFFGDLALNMFLFFAGFFIEQFSS
jgi:hypothetical protein